MDNLQFIREFDSAHTEDLVNIYHAVGWLNHKYDNVKVIFETSTHVVIVKYDNKIVGFARALSDSHFNAVIYDVVVAPAFQGKGIASQMVELLLNDFQHLSCIHLISTTGNAAFYSKLGFKKLKTGMAIYHKSDLEAEYTE
ncbi:N-acetyltransferase [Macrococcus hajekii]|uniref:N-acetyltransferase n=1 Tax=Macrococcus hajekii TaxID=198482 RepID=A0A4R6BMH4_9STAP|nr:GNAT family N-acetyltransferase [Macrococcus hajekii]TDM03023.1 N-acetyltransferase [Macrococcus hajekii]GGB05930.1 hypothetical protein GCM10007190_12440 [Macrococcus hajekii]